MAASYQLSQRLFNPLDAFHHVHEFAALEEVAYDIVGSPLSLPNPPPHNLPNQPSEVFCGRRMDDLSPAHTAGHISRDRA